MQTTNTLVIQPKSQVFWLKLTLLSPLSHHDPAQADKSNMSLFRRQKQNMQIEVTGKLPEQNEIDRLCELFPVPIDTQPFFQQVTLPQFLGAAFVRLFIDMYGSEEGEGLFSGMERYRFLETRFRQAAVRSHTLFEFWALACHDLQTGVSGEKYDHKILSLLSMPSSLATQVLHEFAVHARVLVLLGREWATTAKLQNKEYAKKTKHAQADSENIVLSFKAEEFTQDGHVRLQVPTFSGNSARHEMVREPGMIHLFSHLGLGLKSVPKGVQAIFENGNNIRAGVSEPASSYAASQIIFEKYPLLALLGGCTDSWILGHSNLSSCNAWLISKENNDALQLAEREVGIDLRTQDSIFDMLDEWMLTRQAGRSGVGQMPYSFEAICKGEGIAIRFALSPYTTPLEMGALLAAIDTYCHCDNTLGGQAARHFGLTKLDWLQEPTPEEKHTQLEYETYLADHKEDLRQGLIEGTLCTSQVVCK